TWAGSSTSRCAFSAAALALKNPAGAAASATVDVLHTRTAPSVSMPWVRYRCAASEAPCSPRNHASARFLRSSGANAHIAGVSRYVAKCPRIGCSVSDVATSDMLPPLRAVPVREPTGRVERMIGDDQVGPRPAERQEGLQHDAPLVDPAALGGGLHHAVLAAHVVDRERNVGKRLPRPAHDVEVREAGLHHDHVGPLLQIDLVLAH